jgi:CBS domain-containing protein
MKVEEICTRAVKSCTRETSLAEAADLMWETDCGILPVIDEAGKVIGVATDRDICMALALTGQPAADVPVRVLLRPVLHTCRPADEARDALRTMRTQKVRRLPVVDGAGVLLGMLSFSDVALAAKPDRLAGPSDVSDEDLVLALKAISDRKPAAVAPSPASQATAFA